MTEKNKSIWDQVKQPPAWALKPITAGRLKGKSDINPQWRYQVMTEVFGPCGIGWKFEIKRIWTESGATDQVFAMAEIVLYVKHDDIWSDPIPGVGGSMLIVQEKNGLYCNDEAYKMAVTDALSTAMKMLGVAADVYMGLWDGTKYRNGETSQSKGAAVASRFAPTKKKSITEEKPPEPEEVIQYLEMAPTLEHLQRVWIQYQPLIKTWDNEVRVKVMMAKDRHKSELMKNEEEVK